MSELLATRKYESLSKRFYKLLARIAELEAERDALMKRIWARDENAEGLEAALAERDRMLARIDEIVGNVPKTDDMGTCREGDDMTATATVCGRPTVWDDEHGSWAIPANTLCPQCGVNVVGNQPDPCCGTVPGVLFACCGHGRQNPNLTLIDQETFLAVCTFLRTCEYGA